MITNLTGIMFVLTVILGAAVLAVALYGIYLLRTMNRMQRILRE